MAAPAHKPMTARELLASAGAFDAACAAAAGGARTLTGSAATRPRRRLPIYGERDIDFAVREAVDDYGYGEWLIRKREYDLAWDIDCEADVAFASVHDVDRHLAADAEAAAEAIDDDGESADYGDFPREEREAHEERRLEFALWFVRKRLRRHVEASELEHWTPGSDAPCAGGQTMTLQGLAPPSAAGVYAIEGVPGWVKIGKAKNIASRIRDLQVGQPVPLRLLAVLSTDPADETTIHRRWHANRGTGEWFRLDRALLDFITTARGPRP